MYFLYIEMKGFYTFTIFSTLGFQSNKLWLKALRLSFIYDVLFGILVLQTGENSCDKLSNLFQSIIPTLRGGRRNPRTTRCTLYSRNTQYRNTFYDSFGKNPKEKVYTSTDILDLFITQTQVTHKVKGNIAFKRKYA